MISTKYIGMDVHKESISQTDHVSASAVQSRKVLVRNLYREVVALHPVGIENMARPARFERATLCLEGRCSIQLSYGRVLGKFNYFILLRRNCNC